MISLTGYWGSLNEYEINRYCIWKLSAFWVSILVGWTVNVSTERLEWQCSDKYVIEHNMTFSRSQRHKQESVLLALMTVCVTRLCIFRLFVGQKVISDDPTNGLSIFKVFALNVHYVLPLSIKPHQYFPTKYYLLLASTNNTLIDMPKMGQRFYMFLRASFSSV